MDTSVIRLSVVFQFLIVVVILTSATFLAEQDKISGEVVATVFGGALGYAGGRVERGRAADARRGQVPESYQEEEQKVS